MFTDKPDFVTKEYIGDRYQPIPEHMEKRKEAPWWEKEYGGNLK